MVSTRTCSPGVQIPRVRSDIGGTEFVLKRGEAVDGALTDHRNAVHPRLLAHRLTAPMNGDSSIGYPIYDIYQQYVMHANLNDDKIPNLLLLTKFQSVEPSQDWKSFTPPV